jgi:uncharacterized membrane protein YedE/YeeE
MMRDMAAGASGLLFGLGLIVSGMVNPTKILMFLDIFGNWDPSLALVMAAAIPVAAAGYAMASRLNAPLYAPTFTPPTLQRIDIRLFAGAGLFGVGWGLAGYCPGPAMASLGFGAWQAALFVCAMVAGMALFAMSQKV